MKPRGLPFGSWLKAQLKSPSFKKAYEKEDIRARLALRIAELRKKQGITQGDLARRLKTTQQVVSDIETYRHANITLGTLQRIAQALNSRLVLDLRLDR
ncbi:MAG: helix-turn-helix transcriptional regulator [Elusimicrobiota bacterium]